MRVKESFILPKADPVFEPRTQALFTHHAAHMVVAWVQVEPPSLKGHHPEEQALGTIL